MELRLLTSYLTIVVDAKNVFFLILQRKRKAMEKTEGSEPKLITSRTKWLLIAGASNAISITLFLSLPQQINESQ